MEELNKAMKEYAYIIEQKLLNEDYADAEFYCKLLARTLKKVNKSIKEG